MIYLLPFRERITQHGFVLPSEFEPCTLDEVFKLEKQVGLKLPEAYKEFLLWMGHGAGRFERGSACFYDDDLVSLQEDARELLQENDSPDLLPDDAFVFWMHQGYQFEFFCTSDGDNPPTHYYHEGKNQDRIIFNRRPKFSDFLIKEMEAHAEWIADTQDIRARMARDWRNT